MFNLLFCIVLLSIYSHHDVQGLRTHFIKNIRRSHKLNVQPIKADEITGWSKDKNSWFMENYWQKKPLLIRSAIDEDTCLKYTKKDLLFLTTDDDVESRLIRKRNNKFDKTYGPFEPYEIRNLQGPNWTILVQEVDRHIPWIADIWTDYFNFIPLWRRDDVMISYSSNSSGIGGHVDNYDVFLIQGSGVKQWSIENHFISNQEEFQREVPHTDTRLLRDFHSDQSWIMNPGDMLYLPPRIAHQGISLSDDCVTISMGFRAPTYESLHVAYCQYMTELTLAKQSMVKDHYNSQDTYLSSHPGMISTYITKNIQAVMQKDIAAGMEDESFSDFLGKYLTTPLRIRVRTPASSFFLQPSSSSSKSDTDTDTDNSESNNVPTTTSSNSNSNDEKKKKDNISEDTSLEEIETQSLDNNNNDKNEVDGGDYDDDDDEEELPLCISGPCKVASSHIYSSMEDIIEAFMSNKIYLRRHEGIRMAYINNKLYVEGEEHQYHSSLYTQPLYPILLEKQLGHLLTYNNRIQYNEFMTMISIKEEEKKNIDKDLFYSIFHELIKQGYLYPVDL